LGQFATPADLALEIADFVKSLLEDDQAIHFCDPAVGTGAFYSALRTVFADNSIASAVGVEIDPSLARIARELWGRFGLRVVEGDFTRFATSAGQARRPNVILTNPPYVRHHHMEREYKAAIQRLSQKSVGLRISGLTGLYVHFVLLATEWMSDGGIGAWLIPSEFMDVNYGEALRRYLSERVTLIRIHRFDPQNVQFDDALVSSAVVVFRKTVPSDSTEVRFTLGGSLEEPAVLQDVPLSRLCPNEKWTLYPPDPKDESRTCNGKSRLKFSDLFEVRRGIATGSDKTFILPRDEALRLGLPEKWLKPILPSPRHLKRTILEADTAGYPKIETPLAVIDCALPEAVVREDYPTLWAYFCEAEKTGVTNRYLLRRRTPWYKLEQRKVAPFLCTYMGRGAKEKRPFRFIWNRTAATATNLYLLVYPRDHLARVLRSRSERAAEVFEFLCGISGVDLRNAGRVYGGGLHKMEPKELGAISVDALVRMIPELESAISRSTLFDV